MRGRVDLVLLGLCLAWVAWVLIRAVGARALAAPETAGYLVPVAAFLLGLLLGRRCGRRALGTVVAAGLVVLAGVLLLGTGLYANAAAALGVQLVAAAGLLLGPREVSEGPSDPPPARPTGIVVLAAALASLGLLLAATSQAASVLALGLAVLVAGALTRRTPLPTRWVLGTGLGGLGAATAAVLVLGAAPSWPGALSANDSLSWARHELWSDALHLWAQHPLAGGGPGAFHASSGLSQEMAHLYTAHSSLLQTGSDLGAVGALLRVLLLVTTTVVAARRGGAGALIGVAAWTALGVHSMMDHLLEQAVLVLVAGIVVGWAGAAPPRARDDAATR